MNVEQKGVGPVFSPFTQSLLAVHQYQGKSNDCGPYTAAIVINALQGLRLDGTQLAHQMERLNFRPFLTVRRFPGWATFPWGVTGVLREYGLKSSWHFLANQGLLDRALSHSIAIPIFGSWKPFWAHFAILVADHPELGWGFVDPAHPKGEIIWRSKSDYKHLWRAFGNLLVTVNFSQIS